MPAPARGLDYALAGQRGEALKILDQLQELSNRTYVSSEDIARIYMGLGEEDLAFEWLDKAYDEHAGTMVYLKVAAYFDPLRSDPRFQELLRRMNFPE